MERLSRIVDGIAAHFEYMPDPVYLPYYYSSKLSYFILEYNFRTKKVTIFNTPEVDWRNIHYINMGKGVLFGVRDSSNETWKCTFKKINFTEIEFTKERFDYPGSAKHYPSLVNVNDKFAYLISGH